MIRYPNTASVLGVRGFASLLLCCIFAITSWAQTAQTSAQTKNSQNHDQPPPPTDHEQFVAYWTTETGWNSELQLRNNLVAQDLTVTPALRLPDGAETSLAAVTIKPQEVTVINLDTTLGTTAPQLIGTYGSLVLRYRSSDYRNLYAVLMIHKVGHPIAFHIDGMGEDQDYDAGSREGIWWLPKETTTDYLILTNQGKVALPLVLSLYGANGQEKKHDVFLGLNETSRLSVRRLLVAAGILGSYGGIKVSAASHAGSLDTLHLLYDETAAFSATLKMFDHDPNSKLEQRDFAKTGVWTSRAPMLALSNPDPSLAFPEGTKLLPQLFIRNTTSKPIDATLRFNWRTSSSVGTAPGPALRLNPYETRRIDVAALQDGGQLPKLANWTSVALTTNGLPDEVMAVAASYDSTLRYGAQTPFSDQLASRWEGSMWEFDTYHDSIITAGNGGTKPTQAAFTIFYNQGTQKYELEQTLKPDEQMWIDVGKLIREHVLDKDGKTLPADLTSGSYEFRDLTDIGVGSLFEGKVIYDKTYGHVAYGCGFCCTYTNPIFTYNPLDFYFGNNVQNNVRAFESCTATYYDVSSAFWNNWSTVNTAIATVAAGGVHTAVSLGSTTSNTHGNLISGTTRLCPTAVRYPSGVDNVQVPTSLKVVSTKVIDMSLMGCAGAPYGIAIATQYQVLDQAIPPNPIKSTAMLPQEEITNIVFNGVPQPDEYPQWHNIGPTPYPGTSLYTDANGQFIDAPFGVCTSGVFTETSQQKISMLLNGTNFLVRTSQWTITGGPSGHGSAKNNQGDVNLSH